MTRIDLVDPSTASDQAAEQLAVEAARTRGHLGEDMISSARAAGVSDEEMVEVIGNVVFSSLTNYVNEAFQVDVDWPLAPALENAAQ